MRNFLLECQNSVRLAEELDRGSLCYGLILPVGCLEQHGPVLPLGCDTKIAEGAAMHLADMLHKSDRYRAYVLPSLAYAPSPGAESICGTVSVSFDLLGNLLKEVVSSALKTAWRFLAVVNAHAHNHGRVIELSIAGAEGQFGRPIPIPVINIYEYAHLSTSLGLVPGGHAGEFEIALYNYYCGPEHIGVIPQKQYSVVRNRPPGIFGLDLGPRSFDGVIAPKLPQVNRAIELSGELGKSVDAAMFSSLVEDLRVYFSEWNQDQI